MALGILDEIARLVDQGYPNTVAERIATGILPMDTASRMQRAEAMGFDPQIFYHGTNRNVLNFDRGLSRSEGDAIFASDEPSIAKGYARKEGANLMPLLIKSDFVESGKPFPTNFLEMPEDQRFAFFDQVDRFNDRIDRSDYVERAIANAGGKDVVIRNLEDPAYYDPVFRRPSDIAAIVNPQNIRSYLSAAFDPEYKGSNILGSGLLGATALGAAMAPEEAEAGVVDDLARAVGGGANLERLQRAVDQGFINPQYHASMQDFREIVPGYSDGLFFTTPNPEFASNWAGKGKLKNREGEPDFYDRYKPQKEKLYEEMGSPELETPEYDEFVNRFSEIYRQEENAFKTIYPLLTRTDRTFDPAKNFDDLADLYTPEHLASGFNTDFPTFADALKGGNYILYENPEVLNHLKAKGYDSMLLRESTFDEASRTGPYTTLAHFYPNRNVRSAYANFAEGYSGPDIMGAATPAGMGIAGLLGAGGIAAMSPEQQIAEVMRQQPTPEEASALALQRTPQDAAVAYAPKSETVADITSALRDVERSVAGSPASLLFPESLVNYAEMINRGESPTFLDTVFASLDLADFAAAPIVKGVEGAGKLMRRSGLFDDIQIPTDPSFFTAPQVDRGMGLLQRVGDVDSVNQMKLDVLPGAELAPRVPLNAADLEGRGYVSGMSDTSRGDLSVIVGLNGQPIRAVRHGGQDYMRQPQNVERNRVWSSDSGAVTSLLNAGQQAYELSGKRRMPALIPYGMVGSSTDFATMTADVMLPIARQNMSKAEKKLFDERVRAGAGSKKNEFAPQPDWPGIDSPQAEEWIANSGGARKAITKAIDEFRDSSGINLSQSRAALVDPNQLYPRVGDLMNAAILDLNSLPQPGLHPTYSTDLFGRFLGTFGQGANLLNDLSPVIRSSKQPFVDEMIARGHNLDAESVPSPVGKAMQAGLIGVFNQEILDDLIKKGLIAP